MFNLLMSKSWLTEQELHISKLGFPISIGYLMHLPYVILQDHGHGKHSDQQKLGLCVGVYECLNNNIGLYVGD